MKNANQAKPPLGIKVISVILFFMGLLFLIVSLFFANYTEAINEKLNPLGLSSGLFAIWFMALAILAFFASYGLDKGKRSGWLAAITFFSFFILMDVAALFIDRTEVKYEIGILSLISLYYLSRKNIREIYKNHRINNFLGIENNDEYSNKDE